MRRIRLIVSAAAILALFPLIPAGARGTGGLTWGEQYFDGQFSNYDIQAGASGLFGYTVTRGGTRVGGFALALHADDPATPFDAGFVGSITGQEIRTGGLVAGVSLWTGIGGITANPLSLSPASFALFGEATLDVGVTTFPGATLTVYAGMQAIAPVLPVLRAFDTVLYTPTFGVRLAWGN